MENGNLYREKKSNLEIFSEVINNLISATATDMDEVLRFIVSGSIEIVNASTGVIYLIDEIFNEDEIKIINTVNNSDNFFHPVPRLKNINGLTRTIIREKKIVVIDDFDNIKNEYKSIDFNPELLNTYESFIGIPIIYMKKVKGVLFVHSKNKKRFSDDEKSLLLSLSQLAGITIRNNQLFHNKQRKNTELEILNNITQYISSRSLIESYEELLELIYNQTKKLMNVDNFYIALWDEKKKYLSFEYVIEDGKEIFSREEEWSNRYDGNAISEYIINTKKSLLLKNNVLDFLNEKKLEISGNIPESYLGVPMILGEEIIGIIAVQNYLENNSYDKSQQILLEKISSQTAIALQNKQLYGQVETNHSNLDLLIQANNQLINNQKDDLLNLLRDYLINTCRASNAKSIVVVFISDKGEFEQVLYSSKDLVKNLSPRKNGITKKVWKNKIEEIIPDVSKYDSDIELNFLEIDYEVKAALGLIWKSLDKPIGVIWLYYDKERNFSPYDIDHLKNHFNQAAYVYKSSLEIEKQYEFREQMVSVIAHELETPILGIAANTIKIKDKLRLNKENIESNERDINQSLSKLINQCERLESQNNTMLTMFGGDVQAINFEYKNIYNVLWDSRELFKMMAREKGCVIKYPFSYDKRFPTIMMAEDYLRMAFDNLISNAVKYSYKPPSDISQDIRYITIRCFWKDKTKENYTISIQNYGVGIEESEIESKIIFEPFERGKNSGDQGRPGKGLGLSLVHRVVVGIHSGDIKIESRRVIGGAYLTTFSITLPVIQKHRTLINSDVFNRSYKYE